MNISDRVRWTTADLELLPDNGNRYENDVLTSPLLLGLALPS